MLNSKHGTAFCRGISVKCKFIYRLQVTQRRSNKKENDTPESLFRLFGGCLGMLSLLQGIAFNLLQEKEFHKLKLLARWNFLINFLVFGIKHNNEKGSSKSKPD